MCPMCQDSRRIAYFCPRTAFLLCEKCSEVYGILRAVEIKPPSATKKKLSVRYHIVIMELSCSWYHHYMETPIIIPYNSMIPSNSMVLPDDTLAIQSRSCGQSEWGFWYILMTFAHLAWSWKKPLERWCWSTHTHTHTGSFIHDPVQGYGSCSFFCWSVLEKRLVRNLKSSVRLQHVATMESMTLTGRINVCNGYFRKTSGKWWCV